MNMSDSKNRCTKGYRCESCKAAKSCTDPAKSYIPDVRRGTRKLLSGKYGILVAILLLAIPFHRRRAGRRGYGDLR